MYRLFLCFITTVLLARAEQVTLGKVEVDSTSRTIQFPVYANLEQGIIEFALVHKNGKIHESLFFTEVTGSEINTALRLLGFKGDEKEHATLPILEDLSKSPQVSIEIITHERSYTMSEFIKYTLPEKLPESLTWAYTGSFFNKGRYTAETEGDLIAIFSTAYAVINLDHKSRADDTVWLVNENAMFPSGTACELKITVKSTEKADQ